MLKTSYYFNPYFNNNDDYAKIAISAGIPEFIKTIPYKKLAPTWDMIRKIKAGDKQFYWDRFELMLSRLDQNKVYNEIFELAKGKEPVLLCWERDNTNCHRKRVAEWFGVAGFQVTEL